MSVFYTNISKNDLVISDIGVTIRVGQTINPYKVNPALTPSQLHDSEQIGGVHKAMVSRKLSRSHTPPKITKSGDTELTESMKFIPSRTRVGIAIDPLKKQYIEDLIGPSEDTLDKFQDFSDGFSEPDISYSEGEGQQEAEVVVSPDGDRYVPAKSTR
jgi:hypothetical protein